MEEGSLDKWEIELEIKREELKKCQLEHQIKSCLSCSKINSCEVRDSYVHAVYSSMNKGAGGGFEF